MSGDPRSLRSDMGSLGVGGLIYLPESVNRSPLDLYDSAVMGRYKITEEDIKLVGEVQLSYGAPPEVKILVVLRGFIQEVLMDGMIRPSKGIYPRVVGWMQRLSLLELDDDLLTSSPRRGSKYRKFLRYSVKEMTAWVRELRDMDPEDSCNDVIESYCPLHKTIHKITTEEAFSVKLVEYLGFLRCVSERTDEPVFEIEGEEDGSLSYRAMVEEEQVWRERKRCGV